MPDLNRESLEIWNSLKPMVDEEIKSQIRGAVQRRKAKVTTAPSLATNTIGVTEPFGSEIFVPFATNLISATVGDVVWVEFMYGATNAFVSMFASADEKDWDVAGDLSVSGNAGISGDLSVSGSTSLQKTTVNGVLDVTNRRTNAVSLSAPGWYRAICVNRDSNAVNSFSIDITIGKTYAASSKEIHTITLLAVNNNFSFVNEASSGNALDIQGIRYTRVTGGAGYVDIKYSTSNANDLYVDFNVRCKPGNEAYFIPQSLQSVADSPSDETIRAQYTFSKSTNGDYTFSNVFGKTWYFRKRNGVVYVDAPEAMTPTTNGLNTIGTLPDEFKPNYNVRLPVANNSGKDKWLYISTAGAVTAFCYTNAGTSTPFSVTASYLAMN